MTLAYGVPTTLYFAATQPLGATTQSFGTNVLTPFEAYFALTGEFSDTSLFGETIPYPYGIITQANAYTTPTVGASAATVTVKLHSSVPLRRELEGDGRLDKLRGSPDPAHHVHDDRRGKHPLRG